MEHHQIDVEKIASTFPASVSGPLFWLSS